MGIVAPFRLLINVDRVRAWLRDAWLTDANINFERHIRVGLGAVIASVIGDPAFFVSADTKHKCASGEADRCYQMLSSLAALQAV